MKKILKKSLMFLLSLAMVITTVMPVAFADETAEVSITFANLAMENTTETYGLRVTNVINSNGEHTDVEGTYIDGGIITFNFGEPMDPATLTPENIKIYLNAAESEGLNINTTLTPESLRFNTFYIKDTNTKFNSETNEWTYTPYEVTETSYSISIADMCEGVMVHEVKFTSGVKTANQEPIAEVTKKFTTGRITTTQSHKGKVLKDVAYGKTVTGNASANVITTYSDKNSDRVALNASSYIKIDLGGYYDIADIVIRLAIHPTQKDWVRAVEISCSNDPEETGVTATVLGTIGTEQYYLTSSNGIYGDRYGGLGSSGHLGLSGTTHRARYIFLKSSSGAPFVRSVHVLSPVDADYGVLTAKKDGELVDSFQGAGEYEVSVPAYEYKSGAAGCYMIVAGYDVSGNITAIDCAEVTLDDGVLKRNINFNQSTTSMKAVLIKDFLTPQMLTEALVLNASETNE